MKPKNKKSQRKGMPRKETGGFFKKFAKILLMDVDKLVVGKSLKTKKKSRISTTRKKKKNQSKNFQERPRKRKKKSATTKLSSKKLTKRSRKTRGRKKLTAKLVGRGVLSSKKKTSSKKTKKASPSKKEKIFLEVAKAEENPIIIPIKENGWEAWQTFNPGAVLLENRVHFLYRSIGADGISRFGYASSQDGFTIDERLPFPVFQHPVQLSSFFYHSFSSGGSFGGAEDPRIIQVEEDNRLYVTYTACDGGLRVALTSIKTEDFLKKNWNWSSPAFISAPEEIHKNWVIFPTKFNGKYAILHSISPEISIEYVDSLDFKDRDYIKSNYQKVIRKNCWDNWRRGVGPAPIRTKYGWLLLYHAMSANDFSKYKVGAMLLDLEDPTKIIAVSPKPILEPDRFYENDGFKAGVIYVTGAVVKDGTLLIYYGGADSYVCVAYAEIDQFLEDLIKNGKPVLQKKKIVKKKRKKVAIS
ncbi:MAG: hypothetical protein PHQ20_03760 [Candidatus Moranbacteria bacterium]|jgi:predicted GH43/DUF377 family glycosyl hydrolase|nr:hypothetical protein [Candidatus Moranbacteria bacterium]